MYLIQILNFYLLNFYVFKNKWSIPNKLSQLRFSLCLELDPLFIYLFCKIRVVVISSLFKQNEIKSSKSYIITTYKIKYIVFRKKKFNNNKNKFSFY